MAFRNKSHDSPFLNSVRKVFFIALGKNDW
jgi:hypothetical protein